jgi:hypothetical protein
VIRRDSSATVYYMVNGTMGEATVPFIVGKLVGIYGSQAFPVCVVMLVVLMLLSYTAAHLAAVAEQKTSGISSPDRLATEENTHFNSKHINYSSMEVSRK